LMVQLYLRKNQKANRMFRLNPLHSH